MVDTNKYVTGPRAILKVNGAPVGYCTGITIQENVEYQPIEPIGSIHTVEHAEVAYRVTGTCDFVRIFNNNASSNLLWTDMNDFKDGITPLEMEVLDQVQDKTLYTVFGFKPESRSFRVEGRTLAGENVSWVAKAIKDESQTVAPDLSP